MFNRIVSIITLLSFTWTYAIANPRKTIVQLRETEIRKTFKKIGILDKQISLEKFLNELAADLPNQVQQEMQNAVRLYPDASMPQVDLKTLNDGRLQVSWIQDGKSGVMTINLSDENVTIKIGDQIFTASDFEDSRAISSIEKLTQVTTGDKNFKYLSLKPLSGLLSRSELQMLTKEERKKYLSLLIELNNNIEKSNKKTSWIRGLVLHDAVADEQKKLGTALQHEIDGSGFDNKSAQDQIDFLDKLNIRMKQDYNQRQADCVNNGEDTHEQRKSCIEEVQKKYSGFETQIGELRCGAVNKRKQMDISTATDNSRPIGTPTKDQIWPKGALFSQYHPQTAEPPKQTTGIYLLTEKGVQCKNGKSNVYTCKASSAEVGSYLSHCECENTQELVLENGKDLNSDSPASEFVYRCKSLNESSQSAVSSNDSGGSNVKAGTETNRPSAAASRSRGGWLKWLFIGLGVLAVIGGSLFAAGVFKRKKSKSQPVPASATPVQVQPNWPGGLPAPGSN